MKKAFLPRRSIRARLLLLFMLLLIIFTKRNWEDCLTVRSVKTHVYIFLAVAAEVFGYLDRCNRNQLYSSLASHQRRENSKYSSRPQTDVCSYVV